MVAGWVAHTSWASSLLGLRGLLVPESLLYTSAYGPIHAGFSPPTVDSGHELLSLLRQRG